jgi:hypothetical protein
MKPFLRTHDGRGAYFALYNHFLGAQNKNILVGKYEAEIRRLRYYGEKRNFNFEKYVTQHRKCHNALRDLEDHGYPGLDKGTKVRLLIDGIQDPKLAAATAAICMTDTAMEDFEEAVSKYKNYMATHKTNFPEDDTKAASIGAVQKGKPTKKRSADFNWDTSEVEVELRHHTSEEYKKLSGPQKLKLKRWRAGQADFPVGKATAYNPNDKMMKQISAMFAKQNIASKASTKKKAKTTNRNNKALTKQKSNDDDAEADE